jgi:hypothetical protein
MDDDAANLFTDLGSGFKYLRFTQVGADFLVAIELLCEVTTALDQYCRAGAGAPDLADLVVARNAAQHALLSVAIRTSAVKDQNSLVQEAYRQAALIYSDMTIFPIAASQELRPRLGKMLKETLQTIGGNWSRDLNRRSLVWVATMGAFASPSGDDQNWFIQFLRSQITQLGISDWWNLQAICRRFLWWDPVCSVSCEGLWRIGTDRSDEDA